jgi:hypothetical protein
MPGIPAKNNEKTETSDMISIAILVAIAVLAGVGSWWWSRRSRARPVPHRATRAAERFAAVEIRRRSGSCKAAAALDGQRFLANRSPALPLVGCTQVRCDCSFVKYSDRRADDRRWGQDGHSAALFNTAQRRKLADRRDTL